MRAVAEVTNDIINGVVAIYHGFWRSHIGGNTVNVSVLPTIKIGRGITVNDTKVWIEPIEVLELNGSLVMSVNLKSFFKFSSK